MSNELPQSLERQAGKGLETQFTLDDAFSDGEDPDESLEFTSAAIRDHLAQQRHWNREEQGQTDASSVHDQDTSISTLYLDGSVCDSKFESLSQSSQPRTPAELKLPHELSTASLPDDPTLAGQTNGHPDDLETEEHVSAHNAHPQSDSPEGEPSESMATSRGEPSIIPAAASLPLPPIAPPPPPPPHQRQSRSAGPSTFQKVMSKTRPHFLPPKSKQEDSKHLADWESMMRQSRAAEEKRRTALQERRLARELKIEQSMHVWEKEILPDWRIVNRNPNLRRLWWTGIPTKLRALMWERAAGNALALGKDNYRTCLSRAKRALSSGAFPSDVLQAIEEDIIGTLPALHIFHPETGPLYQDLKDMLCAWVVCRADEGLGYTAGISRIAAMILINMSAPQAFVVMRNLLERHCMRSFYGGTGTKEDVEAYYRIFDTLLADGMPKIYFNFKQHQISPAAYLPDWLISLFVDHLPFEACARIWDVLLLEGDSFLFRAALAILAVLEPRLFFPDRRELLELLKGENRAAIEVAKRDGCALDGAKYEIYGVNEETLWERIYSMDEWWRETTWKRLTQRELPDL